MNSMNLCIPLLLLACGILAAPLPTPEQLAWQKIELTMFCHFGVNTFTDREWGDGKEDEKIFNPSELDCDQWVQAAQAGGFKLMILTAKHHDGFCLWPSAHTRHSVKLSPWKNGKGDVVREFVTACRKGEMKVGLYLSPWDRHEASYGTDGYNDYFCKQFEKTSEEPLVKISVLHATPIGPWGTTASFALTPGKPAKASDVHGNNTQYGGDKAVDGDRNTRCEVPD